MSKRILYLVNVDWFFLSHRLPIALEAKNNGAEVYVATTDTGHRKKIESYGFKFIDIQFSRKGTNFIREIMSLPRIYNLYRKLNPDLVHHVTIKPVIYGSLVARLFKNLKVVNAITGMGFAFSNDDKASSINKIVKKAYKLGLRNKNVKVIFQNEKDKSVFIDNGLVKDTQTILIRGSGVNCSEFEPKENTDNEEEIVILASRMIFDKGIEEFVSAAEKVKEKRPQTKFILAGKTDKGNPNVVSEDQLIEWNKQGFVDWIGHTEDMVGLISKSTIITLPTYYPEGVPKILIESAACGKPIITTNRPGCNDIVIDGKNGILIPERDSQALADAILELLHNPIKMKEFGRFGRELVLKEFSEDIVVDKTMELYNSLLN
jgi:glycosyltransferase involved in cell wall biosynthesis